MTWWDVEMDDGTIMHDIEAFDAAEAGVIAEDIRFEGTGVTAWSVEAVRTDMTEWLFQA